MERDDNQLVKRFRARLRAKLPIQTDARAVHHLRSGTLHLFDDGFRAGLLEIEDYGNRGMSGWTKGTRFRKKRNRGAQGGKYAKRSAKHRLDQENGRLRS